MTIIHEVGSKGYREHSLIVNRSLKYYFIMLLNILLRAKGAYFRVDYEKGETMYFSIYSIIVGFFRNT